MGLDKEDQGIFGISWSELWKKSGMDKLGWVEAVKAARTPIKNQSSLPPHRFSADDLTASLIHPISRQSGSSATQSHTLNSTSTLMISLVIFPRNQIMDNHEDHL